MFVAEEWIEKVFEVQRVLDRIILVKLIVGQRVVTFLSVYAPQSGLTDEVKDLFFDQLSAVIARIPASEFLIPCGHWKGQVGHAGTGYREKHGGMGYGRTEPDVEGERILEYALAFDLFLGNTCFKKRDSHLFTYMSGNTATQIDFILFHRTMRKLVTDVKVIPGEEVTLQHQLRVCNMRIDVPPESKHKFTLRLKVWKLKDPLMSNPFQEVFNLHVSMSACEADGATEDICNNIKISQLKTTDEVCGTTLLPPHPPTTPPPAIIRDGKVPFAWEQSFIVCLYKGKGDALEKGNYRGLKLTEQVMRVLERIVDGLIRQMVSINDSQFGFVPGRGTTDAIFVVRQLQEKYLAANKRLYMTFVDLEKAFDWVPWKVIWWALRKFDVEEWIVRLVQGMYANARSHVCVGEGYSEEFEVKVSVHQGSVLSPLLFRDLDL